MNMPKKGLGFAAVAASAALVLAACGGSSSSSTDAAASAAPASSAAAAGGTVTIWTSVDQPVMDGLKAGLAPLAEAQGITVDWQKVDNINDLIITKVQAGETPDIALIPQPGVIQKLVDLGAVKPLDDLLPAGTADNMIPGELEAGTMSDGKIYGLLTSMNVKGLVWYPKAAWEANGYAAPTTMDELNTLTDEMAKAGQTPWCNGIESGGATGWPATDWMENLVMRYAGVEAYNKWVAGDIKFDSPEFRQAAAEFEKLFFNDKYVNGGTKSIAATSFGDASKGLFTDAKKPACMMYMQGSFIPAFFPENIQADLDNQVGVFGLPSAKAGEAAPVEGGGDLSVLLTDNPAAATVIGLLTDPAVGVEAAKSSSYLSPFKTFDVATYPGVITQQIANIAYGASYFLFDGSDAMPAEVGAGSFWKEMTAWIAGEESLDDAIKNIDASWPAS
jgi:alpha-glucoside transport system substrate-binding protein